VGRKCAGRWGGMLYCGMLRTGSRPIGAGTRCSGANNPNPGPVWTGSMSVTCASGPAASNGGRSANSGTLGQRPNVRIKEDREPCHRLCLD